MLPTTRTELLYCSSRAEHHYKSFLMHKQLPGIKLLQCQSFSCFHHLLLVSRCLFSPLFFKYDTMKHVALLMLEIVVYPCRIIFAVPGRTRVTVPIVLIISKFLSLACISGTNLLSLYIVLCLLLFNPMHLRFYTMYSFAHVLCRSELQQ